MSDIQHVRYMNTPAEWKKIGIQTITKDQLISATPAFLFDVLISSDSEGTADAIVYDGHNAAGKVYIPLTTIDDYMWGFHFDPPIYFRQGIYVDIGSNVKAVVIHCLPEKE